MILETDLDHLKEKLNGDPETKLYIYMKNPSDLPYEVSRA